MQRGQPGSAARYYRPRASYEPGQVEAGSQLRLRQPAWPVARARATLGHRGRPGDIMAPKRPTTDGTGGRKARRTRTDASAPDTTQPPDRERRLVDVDPWAMLLEGLMEVPEETAPAKPKPTRGK